MSQATAHQPSGTYRTVTRMRGHELVLDEPADLGGDDAGPTPIEAVAAALGACTAITIRMYVQRKGWLLDGVDVTVDIDWEARPQTVHRIVTVHGDLDAEQRQRIAKVADACPVHRLLANPIDVTTTEG
jgi:putative redox protein